MKTKKKSHASSGRFSRGVKVGAKSTKRHSRKSSSHKEDTVQPMESTTGW